MVGAIKCKKARAERNTAKDPEKGSLPVERRAKNQPAKCLDPSQRPITTKQL
ncbi:hypothetical protein M5D96_002888 [Drosophila gunungcola]|uniref:Uncharacterized protein n=1 Tax=Drosophila gunungcola TaxID=103775 RepID=A0A9P9Z0S3_9MUSC|nr:hypothetical protein M5D96_002888 [Drosophila gunungcola]